MPVIAPNSAQVIELREDERLWITSSSAVDVLMLRTDDFSVRFSTSQTKVRWGGIFPTVGTGLYSSADGLLAVIEADTYSGRHDLQYDMCSSRSYDIRFARAAADGSFVVSRNDFPTHGCLENLSEAFLPYGLTTSDLPLPLNLFQSMDLAGDGTLVRAVDAFRPGPEGASICLRAETGLLVGVSACPEMFNTGGAVTYSVEPIP